MAELKGLKAKALFSNNGAVAFDDNGVLWQTKDVANASDVVGEDGWYTSEFTILDVNGGANIGVNQRYEIDIASELGSDWNPDEIQVQAEIYNNSGSGVAGWGAVIGPYEGATSETGVGAYVVGDTIVIQTAITVLAAYSQYSGNGFGNSSAITSAPCRVKVWKIK